MENKREEIKLSCYHGYSENRGVIGCPKCDKDIWCDIPQEGQEIECQSGTCDWKGVFVEDNIEENEKYFKK